MGLAHKILCLELHKLALNSQDDPSQKYLKGDMLLNVIAFSY
jgi:hypothetical protein